MSILSLQNIYLSFADSIILSDVTWNIASNARIALVGRNGTGKSSLLKPMQGAIVQDKGLINKTNNLRIASLTQDVPYDEHQTVYQFLVQGLGQIGILLEQYQTAVQKEQIDEINLYQIQLDTLGAWEYLPKIQAMASRLDLNLEATMGQLSGGLKRKALLAACLIMNPDLLLLDEPTNHLDVNTIEWLESYLKTYSGSFIVVTHDRSFLSNVAQQIVELDRGHLYVYQGTYDHYLDRREALRESQLKENKLFDKRLAEEEVWIRTGVKARRTRNEGRVRALKVMREAHQQRRAEISKIQTLSLSASQSGKMMIEATSLNYQVGHKEIIKECSLLMMRGDKIGIIGPNGCGKTTLIRLLIKELTPKSGTVRHGSTLKIAYFDQLRKQLNEQATVIENVVEGSDYILVNGKQKHIVSYLKDFLFSPSRLNQPVFSLSGGEKNRLLLAKLFSKPSNLIIMDEPTNDLDIETLEILEEILSDYKGSVLLISHDRTFINNIVTSVLVYEQGVFNEYVGGYKEFKEQSKKTITPRIQETSQRNKTKLSFKEQQELSQLPQVIEGLESEIDEIQQKMLDSSFYQQATEAISNIKHILVEKEKHLVRCYARWEDLEGKKNGS